MSKEDAKTTRILPPVSKTECLYVGVDGSMISTRDEGYKEAKLARLFNSSDCLNPNTKSAYLGKSQYVAHLGTSKEFCEKTEQVIDSYGQLGERLVFLTDGATWIKNWIEAFYPEATAILDYFHACEHLHEFAESCTWEDPASGEKWYKEQKSLLYESSLDQVLDNIKAATAKEADKEKLLNYYQNNCGRMNYKKYRAMGCGIIGSGAIESAHRTVIQKRMKLSGQHWSRDGAKNMLRLRIFSMNNQWHKVIDAIKKPLYLAA
ncbi:hypothetical protein AGMMS49982_22730 [Bacteroidia bacterium]|nr:hypothetical protein AGMMS49982_22730 [Bacteroidia bacterium]